MRKLILGSIAATMLAGSLAGSSVLAMAETTLRVTL